MSETNQSLLIVSFCFSNGQACKGPGERTFNNLQSRISNNLFSWCNSRKYMNYFWCVIVSAFLVYSWLISTVISRYSTHFNFGLLQEWLLGRFYLLWCVLHEGVFSHFMVADEGQTKQISIERVRMVRTGPSSMSRKKIGKRVHPQHSLQFQKWSVRLTQVVDYSSCCLT